MPAVAATHSLSLEFIAGQEWSQAKEKKYARERNETRKEPRERKTGRKTNKRCDDYRSVTVFLIF